MSAFLTPQCISAFVICRTPDGPRYLLIRRCGQYLPGTWQMVTGGILEQETAIQAALREIKEETGLVPTQLYCADAVETFYMQSVDKITFAPVFVAFVEEMTVELSPSEHDAYEWVAFEEAKKRLVWSEQRRVLAQVHDSFILNDPHPLLVCPILEETQSVD